MRVLDRIAHISAWRGRGTGGKAVLCLGLMGVAMAGPEPFGAPLVLLAAVPLALVSARVPAAVFFGVLATPAGFLATGLPVLAVSVDWNDGLVFAWSADGAWMALMLSVRSLAAVSALALLALTTPPSRLVGVLRRLGLPAVVADLALLTYRLLFVIGDAAATGAQAQSFRLGYRGWPRTFSSLTLLTAGLLSRTLARARRMETGLAARGYAGALPVLATGPRTGRSEWIVALGLPPVLAVAGWGLAWMR